MSKPALRGSCKSYLPSINKNYLAAIILALLLPNRSIATTVVLVITPTGIVMGSDSKGSTPGTFRKIFLLKGRLAVASMHVERVKQGTGPILYDFPVWIKQIDNQVDLKVSVSTLSSVIEDQAPKAFAFLADAIKNDRFTEDEARKNDSGLNEVLVQYVIVGYEAGIPSAYKVILKPDWKLKTLTSLKIPIDPMEGQNIDSRTDWWGRHIAIEQAEIADTQQQKEFATSAPVEFLALSNRKPLTLKQASNVIRALLGMEAKAEPAYVGFPITLVTIPKAGRSWVRTYKQEVSPLSRLPKSKGKDEKKH